MQKRLRWDALVIKLILFSLVLGGCTGLSFRRNAESALFKTADLVGMVYQQGNRPCPGVSVELLEEEKGESVFRGYTDLNGRFLIPDLSRGGHRLRFSRRGYQTLTVSIRFLDPTHVFYTRLVSLEDLLLQAEEALDKNRWRQMDALLMEAARIDPHRGELLFLKVVAAVRQGFEEEEKLLLEQMKKNGFPLSFLNDREEMP